jgi:hypothetical protein
VSRTGVCTIYPDTDTPHASAGPDPFGPYIAPDVGCLCAQSRKYNDYKCVILEAYRCEIIGVATVWVYNLGFSILRLLTFMTEMWANSA